jgi:DNA-binding transcriptional MerR regulator
MNQAKYRVQQVEQLTNVLATTLRQWERRYRFPNPDRTRGGFRPYNDHDVRHPIKEFP